MYGYNAEPYIHSTTVLCDYTLHACGSSAVDEICILQVRIPLCVKVKNISFLMQLGIENKYRNIYYINGVG